MLITNSLSAARTDLPVLGVRGFPLPNLAGLYLFDGADTLSSVTNWAPGGGATAVMYGGDANDAAALMTGGGINLKATAYVPGPEIDWTKPWAAVWQGSVGLPVNPGGAAPWVSALISCQQSTVRGMTVYLSNGSYPTSTTQFAALMRQSVNGTQEAAGSVVGTPQTAGLVYTSVQTVCLRFDGNSTADIVIMRGGAVLASATRTNINKTGMITNGSGVQQPVLSHALGSPTATFNRGNILPEGFAIYGEYINDAKLALIDQAFTAIRTARGR